MAQGQKRRKRGVFKMKWAVIVGAVIKVLDVIHDVLCPFFRDDIQKNDDKIQKSK